MLEWCSINTQGPWPFAAKCVALSSLANRQPHSILSQVEEGLEKRGMFVPKVDYTPVGLSAKDVMSDEAEAASSPVPTMQQQESVDAVVMDMVQTKSPLEPEQVAPSIENKARLAQRVDQRRPTHCALNLPLRCQPLRSLPRNQNQGEQAKQ